MHCYTMENMEDNYRLVFRGEVLEGQHPAVVKKRLVNALKLSDEQAEKLFSGATVVLKKSADAKTAGRLQELFKQAGARLVVVSPAQERSAQPDAQQQADSPASEASLEAVADTGDDGLSLQPLQQAYESAPPIDFEAPDYSLAALGADMGEPRTVDFVVPDADFELAEVGETIPTLARDDYVVIDLDEVNFEVAELGADIGDPGRRDNAAAPDVSHISLAD